MPANPVSNYLKAKIEATGKTLKELGAEAGFKQANAFVLLKSGDMRLPMDRIPGVAKAIEADEKELFELALKHYEPTVYKMMQKHYAAGAVDPEEVKLLAEIKRAIGGKSIKHDAKTRSLIQEVVKNVYVGAALKKA
ncbi:hypothetical protein [Dyella telluris]|uniref:XRE family transcriptional regulator n=1 Tax=Dyella telluris TaxID=2763498 RepID=A0A7G8Q4R7_9GAMM|nr:hypothetical protein [Dyella telluris]QNK01775.1 hypothetical protein H8F01_00915 [Dyella telluris]